MNPSLPNKLTLLRIILTFLFVFFISQEGIGYHLLAIFIFLLASLTDFYDGYLAKKYNLESDFGKIMDPIADKFLILVAFFIFLKIGMLPIWMFVVIFLRELSVTGLRIFAIRKGKIMPAEKSGKLKTVFQIFTILTMLIFFTFIKSHHLNQSSLMMTYGGTLIYLLLLVTVILTLFSGFSYLWNNRDFILHAHP